MKTSSPLIPSRAAQRAHLDAETIYPILDEAIVCTVSFVADNKPFSIPTSFVRYENKLYIHGSVGSHFIRELEKGIPVCITVMLIDALVIAKSAFSHSVNYRSVVLFATAEKIEGQEEKMKAFEWLTNKIVPESWDYLRPVTLSEIKKTTVLAFKIEEASAKVRTGMPNDGPEDKVLPIWSGIIPIQIKNMAPIADEVSHDIPLPKHLGGL
ncbi:pyridoxamine 5'-phosphate oxidase family protein [Pedobacter sp. L105]|uniref:pyridoxamine 5'-phosphate oxidase family protein n=1 Tax=Pedobacter sp. L105 TaxID=1641871 RepID=UPI00131C2D1F|nr:pyridoxamine 5'-phosphate oxidase family protein [Pedobacter sp. L105]